MEFDIDLIREQIFMKRDKIAADFGIAEAAADPKKFGAQIVEVLGQRAVDNPLDANIEDDRLYKAACLAIWSSSTDWTVVVKNEHALASLLGSYEPVVASTALPEEVAQVLHAQYQSSQAMHMLDWAQRLVKNPNYYATAIRPVAEKLRELGGELREPRGSRHGITDEELLVCMAVYFSNPAARWTKKHLPAGQSALKDRKFPGMGFPICSEFLRTLGWNGFKPDVHITRLFDYWKLTCAVDLDTYNPRARVLAELSGRRDKESISHARYALAGIDLTPAGTSPSEADNLIWMLGKYVENKGHETELPYVR